LDDDDDDDDDDDETARRWWCAVTCARASGDGSVRASPARRARIGMRNATRETPTRDADSR
jgi:hypothetical protein